MGSARKRIGDFLKANVGKTVTKEQLSEVAGISEWARRVRELRDEYGWKILSHHDRSSLRPGEYILESAPPDDPGYSFARRMSAKTRARVLSRNGFTCQTCGAGPGDTVNGRKVKLHVGHTTDRVYGGGDELGALKTQCTECNLGARNLTQEPPRWIWLMSQIRSASVDDQQKALDWLKRKFEAGD